MALTLMKGCISIFRVNGWIPKKNPDATILMRNAG